MTENILISIMINKKFKFAKKLSKDLTLPDIRKLLSDKLLNDSIFTLPDGSEIDGNDESDCTLGEIINVDKVYIKSESLKNSSTETQKRPKNKPIEGSQLVGKKGELDIYLYPEIEFTNAEKEKAVIFMVVGQVGSGKTTLLNSFINYLLGIQIEDNFR